MTGNPMMLPPYAHYIERSTTDEPSVRVLGWVRHYGSWPLTSMPHSEYTIGLFSVLVGEFVPAGRVCVHDGLLGFGIADGKGGMDGWVYPNQDTADPTIQDFLTWAESIAIMQGAEVRTSFQTVFGKHH